MLVTLSTANSFGVLGCKTMSILSSRDNMSVWSLRPMWETLVCKVPPPPRTWGYCPLREVPSKPVMFQSSWDKACVPWEADLLLLCLALLWFHVSETPCAVFIVFVRLPLSGLLLELTFPLTSSRRAPVGTTQGSAELCLWTGICEQCAVQTQGCWLRWKNVYSFPNVRSKNWKKMLIFQSL